MKSTSLALAFSIIILAPTAKAGPLPEWVRHPNCIMQIQTLTGSLPRPIVALRERLLVRGYQHDPIKIIGANFDQEKILLQIVGLDGANFVASLRGGYGPNGFNLMIKASDAQLAQMIPRCQKH